MTRRVLIAGFAVAWPLLTAGSCATTQLPDPVVRTVEVKVPVPVTCVPPTLGPPPVYSATKEKLRAAAGPEDRLQMLGAFFVEATARLGETEPVIKGCRTP